MDDVRKSYVGSEVLHGVSATVGAGSFTLLTGPSGSGKTTLLNLVAGLDVPDAGLVTVGDVEVTTLSPDARAHFRAGVGLVFQRSGLLGGLTARENIELGHIVTRHRTEEQWITELTERLGIGALLDAPATTLSGGQAQRVALARALAHRPAVVFADEPTASVDAATTAQIHDLLRSLAHKQGTTVLMVSHDAISRTYADAVITMVDGQIAEPSRATEVGLAPARRRGPFR